MKKILRGALRVLSVLLSVLSGKPAKEKADK